MADRTINININITGNTGTGGGTGGGGGSTRTGIGGGFGNTRQIVTDLSQIEQSSKNIFDLQSKLRKAFKDTASATGEVSAKNKEIKQRLEEVNTQVKKFNDLGKQSKNTWSDALGSYQFKFNALGNIISNVVSQATQMLFSLGASVVTISKDFEFAMSGVKAITMATDAEFKSLTLDAIRLGGATIFTANDVAKLQEELAKLGFTVTEIRAATDAVVALAAATGEDLGQSALVAGTIIRGFGLDASEMSRIVDVMAQSFNASALDLYKFAETMKYVAPIASKIGFSVEEVTTLMAKLADQGIVASQAGTGLRNIMLRLADANSKLSKAMGGPVNSLPELIIGLEKLKKGGIDATGALKLVDRYSVTAFTGLIQASGKLEGMYNTLIKNYGVSQKMADIRMDNFAGSVEKLSGEWQSFILTINKGNGILRVAVDIIRGMIGGITKLFQSYEMASLIASNEDLIAFRKTIDQKIIANNELYVALQKGLTEQYYANINAGMKEIDAKKKLNEQIKKIREQQKEEVRAITELELEDKIKMLEKELPELERIEKEKSNITVIDPGARRVAEKEKERATARLNAKKAEIDDIRKLMEQNDAERVQMVVDAAEMELGVTEDYTAEQKRLMKEMEDAKYDSLRDGMAKELDEVERSHAKELENARKYGYSTKNIYQNIADEQQKIVEKYYEEVFGMNDKIRAQLDQDNAATTEAIFTALMGGKTWKERMAKKAEEERKAFIDLLKKVTKPEEEDPDNKPTKDKTTPSVWNRLKIDSEQEQALKKGFSFITDELQKIADKEVEIADRRVESSERVVNQLQQDLQTEIALAESGFASNVTLKRKELEEAKRQQAEALRIQAEAVKKQQQMQALLQATELISATAKIINSYAGLPIAGQILAIAEIAAMWGTFAFAQVKAKELTKYGEGGEVDGFKHSQGGTLIEAERGEFVVKSSAYDNHKDLVQAINNEDMANVYRALNQDLSVTLDDTNTARMLGKHFAGRKQTEYFNGYRIETIGNRRRTIRNA